MIVRLLLTALLVTGCGGLTAPEPEGPLTGERLVQALREGGLVLYLRHTATEQDAPDGSLSDPCSAQRGLTDAGRAQARSIGAAVRALRVPVGQVLASPFCRTVQTAELAFGGAERAEALLPVPAGASADDVVALLADEPEDGTNTVLVGHATNLRPAAGATPEEGGTVVFRPDGEGAFLVVGEVPPGGWQGLAERYG